MKVRIEWSEPETLTLENSFGMMAREEDVMVDYTIDIDGDKGSFELDGGTDEWHAEGGIFIENGGYVTGYDGIFELPKAIINKLKALGYNTDLVD
jgi:hypothetical protein